MPKYWTIQSSIIMQIFKKFGIDILMSKFTNGAWKHYKILHTLGEFYYKNIKIIKY